MIELFGWSDALQAAFAPQAEQGYLPARVTAHHRGLWRVVTAEGDRNARLSGRFALDAAPGEHPVVGDWLACSRQDGSDDLIIHALLPRKSVFTRRAVSGGGVQFIAANIDIVFLVAALNGDLNLRRLERYLVAARESGAAPVIVLTKSDLAEDAGALVAEVEAIASGSWRPVSEGRGVEAVSGTRIAQQDGRLVQSKDGVPADNYEGSAAGGVIGSLLKSLFGTKEG